MERKALKTIADFIIQTTERKNMHDLQSNLVKTISDKTNNSLVRTLAKQMVGQAFSLGKKNRL